MAKKLSTVPVIEPISTCRANTFPFSDVNAPVHVIYQKAHPKADPNKTYSTPAARERQPQRLNHGRLVYKGCNSVDEAIRYLLDRDVLLLHAIILEGGVIFPPHRMRDRATFLKTEPSS